MTRGIHLKDYYDKNFVYRKSKSYLYLGLVSIALSAVMIAGAILAIVHSLDTAVAVTGFAAGVIWAFAAFMDLYVFYTDNKASVNESVKNTGDKSFK